MANILNYSNTFQFNAITCFVIFTYNHSADVFSLYIVYNYTKTLKTIFLKQSHLYVNM